VQPDQNAPPYSSDAAEAAVLQPQFIKGQVYRRKQDIHIPFGGSYQPGITRSGKTNAVFIFTGESGEKHGYHDAENELGIYTYTGEGQKGNMKMAGGNLAILNHVKEGRTLHLFKSLGKRKNHIYIGEFCCAGHDWSRGHDTQNKIRDIIIFELVPVAHDLLRDFSDELELDTTSREDANISLAEVRKLAIQSIMPPQTGGSMAIRTLYIRSHRIKSYVLMRANGVCESCTKPAPFFKKNGAPYLEPHHINRLSDGGLDHPNFIGAICPACHREIHYGQDGHKKNELLRTAIKLKESYFPLNLAAEILLTLRKNRRT
jgi:5-methylcytosine-specific restriction protein A